MRHLPFFFPYYFFNRSIQSLQIGLFLKNCTLFFSPQNTQDFTFVCRKTQPPSAKNSSSVFCPHFISFRMWAGTTTRPSLSIFRITPKSCILSLPFVLVNKKVCPIFRDTPKNVASLVVRSSHLYFHKEVAKETKAHAFAKAPATSFYEERAETRPYRCDNTIIPYFDNKINTFFKKMEKF